MTSNSRHPDRRDGPSDPPTSPRPELAEAPSEAAEGGTPSERPSSFHLVALGASAGGLEALCGFFDHLAAQPRAAFVVLMHLAPDRASKLVEILSEHSAMPVREIAEGDVVEAGRVYVPPPGTKLTVDGGRFHVSARADPTEHVIDALFASMAEAWRELAVGVVLSGSGSDGSRGITALRGAAALTLAEDPASAGFADMPRSAIRTGHVDVTGSPDSLAEEVGRYLTFDSARVEAGPRERDVRRVLAVVREKRGREFEGYKDSTIRRRIGRRMRLRHCESVDGYVELIQDDGEELDQLVRDLLITVTEFFRDREHFETLREIAVADILDRKEPGDTIRVWVPGCSSGEEAYSLAFLILDEIRSRSMNTELQLFATDLDEEGLQTARVGVYPAGIETDLPRDVLQRYFHRDDGTYQVKKAIRQKIIFSVHDVIRDPPFAHMDLVSCRNLLIYLDSDVQKRALSYLHYALEPQGFLFLGTSESILGSRNLFQPVAPKAKIFRKVAGGRSVDFRFPTSFTGLALGGEVGAVQTHRVGRANLSRLAERAVLKRYAPPGVLVDLERNVVYYFGDTSPYLQSPPGLPDPDVTHMIRSELNLRVRRVLEEVETERSVVSASPVRLEGEGGPETVRVVGHPITELDDEPAYVLLVFEPVEDRGDDDRRQEISEDERSVVQQLEEELRHAKEELRATVEHKEAVNEELRSANEELISMNEELQSTNEELETAKEELQSMNEELETVNTELNSKIEELARTNANMENLLASTQIATLFLDTTLCIKSYTQPATDLFNLIASDRGRPLTDIKHSLEVEGLEARMRRVLDTLEPEEDTVWHTDGRAYAMRIMPYRTEENVIDGVVVTFVDITDLKRAEAEARRLGAVVQASKDAAIIADTDGTIEAWNRGATDTYGYGTDAALGMNMARLVPEEDRDSFRRLLEDAAGTGSTEFEARRVTEDGRLVHVSTTLTVLDEEGSTKLAFTERDVTERKEAERHRELLLRELDHRVKNTIATVQAITERTIVNSGHSMDDFARAFRGRIEALGRVHQALSRQKWEGVHMAALLEQTLAPHAAEGAQRLDGEDIVLPVRVSLPLAMALHELATNAAKYGSLSTDEGRVGISWSVDPERTLEVEWKETGGPPVSEPEGEGFGMTFLRRGIAYELDGTSEVRFESDGVRCTLRIPLADDSVES